MTIAAGAEFHLCGALATADAALRVEVLPDLAAAESLWRGFETTALMSPFQRFDWVAAYAAEAGSAGTVRVATLRDATDRLQLLLPLSISTHLGCRIASGIGGKHASYTMPLAAPGFARPSAEFAGAMAAIGRALGIDAITLTNVPTSWNGVASPLAAWARPAPSPAFLLELSGDAEATFARAMSKDARKKLRSKERALAALGTVTFTRASSGAEAERILAAFYRQKQERFRKLGIRDPFLDEGIRSFLGRAATVPGDVPAPLELFGLGLDGHLLAVFGGAGDRDHLSGMFISFDADHEASRLSPGDLLLSRVVRDSCERSRRGFDLGVGDARYKRTFCDGALPLADVVVPVTLRGQAYAGMRGAGIELKRRVKASPAAMRVLSALRRAKPGAGASSTEP